MLSLFGEQKLKFGSQVREWRNAKGLTSTEAAYRAGVSVPTWSAYEDDTEDKQPRKQTVLKIADALGIPRSEALAAAGYASVAEFGQAFEVSSNLEVARADNDTRELDSELQAIFRRMRQDQLRLEEILSLKLKKAL